MSGRRRFCWLRLRRHRFAPTGALRVAGGPLDRGEVLRCRDCGHETAAVGARAQALIVRGTRASSPP